MELIRPLLSQSSQASAIEDLLRAEASDGGISFSRFMALALHHPEHGYYSRRSPQGTLGDYITSPKLHPIFAWTIAAQLEEFWRACDRPARFEVVEWGAGDGSLCNDALTWAAGTPFGDALRWRLVDSSARARSRQEETCGAWLDAGRASLSTHDDQRAGRELGCLLSNELFDSLPVELVRQAGGHLLQAWVVAEDDQFVLDWREAVDARLATRLEDEGVTLSDGQVAEVCLKLEPVLAEMSARLSRGYFLAFDYGYPASALYASWRKAGTLMTFYRQTPGSEPLVRPGRQDITAHVDFTALARAGALHGWRTAGFTSQAAFLIGFGAGNSARELLRLRPDAAEEAASLRRGVELLTDAGGLGRVRALLLTKDAPGGPFTGFQDDESASLEVVGP